MLNILSYLLQYCEPPFQLIYHDLVRFYGPLDISRVDLQTIVTRSFAIIR